MIKVYGEEGCNNCTVIKNILSGNDIEFDYLTLSDRDNEMQLIQEAQGKGLANLPIVTRNEEVVDWRNLL